METQPRTAPCVVSGMVCAIAAAHLCWVAYTRAPALRVPPAVAYTAAWVFAVAAMRLFQLARRPTSRGDGFGVLITAGLAVIGGWIGFGPGERLCTVGRAMGDPNLAGLACRAPFAAGALLTGAVALYFGWRWIRARTPRLAGPARPRSSDNV